MAVQDAGSASGVLNTGFQLGNSIGLALMGVVFIDRISIGPGRSRPDVFAAAVTHALWFQVGAFVLAFLLMLALPGRTRSQPDGEFRHSSAETITATRGSAS